MSSYDALLEPLTIRSLTLRNRIVSTAHAPGYSKDSIPMERYRLYHEEKAKGGVGLTMIGGSTAVSVDSVTSFGQITLADDRAIPHIKKLVEGVHKHGAACFCQISHSGRRGRWDVGTWIAQPGPSHTREPQHRSFPKEMEDWDFARIARDYQAAARRCKQAGLDGVELLFAGGHLLHQFLSPAVNHRTDKYGGSIENRARYALEIIESVRKGIGDDMVLGIRLTADEFIAEGQNQEEGLKVAKIIAESGMVDYLSIMASQTFDWRSSSLSMPSMAFPLAPYLSLVGAIKQAVKIPVLHAGRIMDLATATRAVEDGLVDLVGMTRAQIADPHMVRKMMERREDDIRPCVGANFCINRIYIGAESLCIQNPATGREATMPHVISRSDQQKNVVIVGAGPAGLEAARVCGERGHKVTLIEAEPQVGGQLNIASKLEWRNALSTIAQWLDWQCQKLGADIWLGYRADVEMVERFNPDIVIIATGGRPNVGPIQGAENVVSAWDVIGSPMPAGERVLLYDDQGADSGMSGADYLSQQGVQLEVVTPERHLGIETGVTTYPTYLENLYSRGVVISPDLRMMRVEESEDGYLVTLRNEYTLKEETRTASMVVSDHGTLPDDELYFELKSRSRNLGEIDYAAMLDGKPQTVEHNPDGKYMLFRVGDAVAGRNIHAAMYDSLRLCKDF